MYYSTIRHATHKPTKKERTMSQNELKNAGYKMVQIAAIEKGFNAIRARRAISNYVDAVNAHDAVNATLVQLIALSVIENA